MKSFTLKSLAGVMLAAALIASAAPGASAQSGPTPFAAGSLRYDTSDAVWGSWEAFSIESEFGFFLRFRWTGVDVATVAPFEILPDGRTHCWWISYKLIGATNPDGTQGWQWVQTATGRVVLDLTSVSSTSTSIPGFIIMLATGKQNEPQVPEPNPQWFPMRLTIP